MTTITKQRVLRANALYLGIAAVAAFLFMDLRGLVFGSGPVSRIISAAPHSAIGFVEAHGLALILAVIFWRVTPERFWHLTAMAAEALLGICNLVFWQIFVAGDALVAGYVSTGLHWAFVVAQLAAAVDWRTDLRLAERRAS